MKRKTKLSKSLPFDALSLRIMPLLPPTNLLTLCDTEDRVNFFKDRQKFYRDVHYVMECILKGEKSTIQCENRWLEKFIALKAARYQMLYEVIFYGWDLIQEGWNGENSRRFKGKTPPLELVCPSTPGELMARILVDESVLDVLHLFPEYLTGNFFQTFSPRRLYKDMNELNNLEKGERESTLSRPQSQKIAKIRQNQWRDLEREAPFQRNCALVLHFIYASQIKHSRELKTALTALDFCVDEINDHLRAGVHPSQRQRGYLVDKGTVRPLP